MTKQKTKKGPLEFYGRGKLLLTGEYFVLDGAKSLAVPTRLGQKVTIKEHRGSEIIWDSNCPSRQGWFKAKFSILDLKPSESTDNHKAQYISNILRQAINHNSEFLSTWKGKKITADLEFEPEWGLGSSSTLLYCLSLWAEANPYLLYFDMEDGSGYDIACAQADGPIIYQLKDDSLSIDYIDLDLSFKKNLYFVYLGNKVDSKQAVSSYKTLKVPKSSVLKEVGDLSEAMSACKSLNEMHKIIQTHEQLVSQHIKVPTIKESKFPDFSGSIKSLGAWGGDFALAASDLNERETKKYFTDKGLNTIFGFEELIHRV